MSTRQLICAVLGHIDHGKCVSPDTIIQLSNGRLITALDLYKLKDKNVKLISYGKGFAKKKPSHFEKREASELIKLKLGNGFSVKTTPEHKYFILTPDGLIEKQARHVNEGDFLVVPKTLTLTLNDLGKTRLQILEKLSNDFLLKLDKDFHDKLVKRVKARGVQQISRKIKYKLLDYHIRKKYFRVKDWLGLCDELGLDKRLAAKKVTKIKSSTQKQRAGHTSPWIKFPRTSNELKSAFYIAGLMFGDGSERVFWNKDEELKEIFSKHVMKAFGVKTTVIKDKTCDKVFNKGGFSFVNYLVKVFNYPLKKKSNSIKLPVIVQTSNNSFSSEFIKGLFDADGSAYANNIEFSSASNEFISQLFYFLQRFGCHFQRKGSNELIMSGYENLNNFCKELNFKLIRKKQLALRIKEKASTNRVYGLTSINGSWLKNTRLSLGLSSMDLKIPYYLGIESHKNVSINTLRTFIKRTIKFLKTKTYQKNLTERLSILKNITNQTPKELFNELNISHRRYQNHLMFLKTNGYITINPHLKKVKNPQWGEKGILVRLIELNKLMNNFNTVQVKEKIGIKYNGFVYDFTIPDNHNFIAGGVLIHNTTILDRIRGTSVQHREAGGITQHTGASEVPIEVIKEVCGPLLKNKNISIPGLLFIDTPGHAAFSSLRQRGGATADIAVLVLDVLEPLQPQAIESIRILKEGKVPFVIALNKIDSIGGWASDPGKFFLNNLKLQSPAIQSYLEERLYSLVNQLSQEGINAERFDRISDFTKEIAIVPTSGLTGEGIPELLMTLTGLAQRYLEGHLQVNLDKPAVGRVLEVKELKGLGTTLDVIITDGKLREGDQLVIGGLNGAIISKARALLKPAPLQEMREKGEFTNVKEVVAASGVKISGPGLDEVVPGVPIRAVWDKNQIGVVSQEVQEQVSQVVVKTEGEGLILKADSLGSLEALANLFKDYPLKKAVVGPVTKSDVIEAVSVRESKPELGVIIAFNVKVLPEAQELVNDTGVSLFNANIIYDLRDKYAEYREEIEVEAKRQALSSLILPAKLKVLNDHVFRASNPAIVGVEVVGGTLKTGYPIINDSLKKVGYVKSIREGEDVKSIVKQGAQVSVSIEGGVIGRNMFEGGTLFTNVSEQHFHKMKTELKKYLRPDEVIVMRELLNLHREKNELWGF